MKSFSVAQSKGYVRSLCMCKNEEGKVTDTLNWALEVYKDAQNCSIVTFSDKWMKDFYVTFTQGVA